MKPLVERFWAKVRKGDGCWEWTASRKKYGYGQIEAGPRTGRRTLKAHRVSWEIHFGAIPDGLCVLHRCDNPPCVRPDHLFLGTIGDNIADMFSKGRQPRRPGYHGERNPRAKFTASVVLEIRQLHAAGHSNASIARKFGVTRSGIRSIVIGETWRSESAGWTVADLAKLQAWARAAPPEAA